MRRVVLVVVALAVAGAALSLALRLLAPGPSDEEAIRALLRDGAQAVAEKRVGDAVERVAERFEGNGGIGRRELKQLLLGHVLRGSWVTVHVAADRVRVEGDAAEAVVLAIAARSGAGAALAELLPADATALRIICRLAREEGAWKVLAARWEEVGVAAARAEGTGWFAPGSR